MVPIAQATAIPAVPKASPAAAQDRKSARVAKERELEASLLVRSERFLKRWHDRRRGQTVG
jgi:hypothetical protein